MDHTLRATLRYGADPAAALRARLRAGQLEPDWLALIDGLGDDDWPARVARAGWEPCARVGLALVRASLDALPRPHDPRLHEAVDHLERRQACGDHDPRGLGGTRQRLLAARREPLLEGALPGELTRSWCVASGSLLALELRLAGPHLDLLCLEDLVAHTQRALELAGAPADQVLRAAGEDALARWVQEGAPAGAARHVERVTRWEHWEWAESPALLVGWSGQELPVEALEADEAGPALVLQRGLHDLAGLLLRWEANLDRLGPHAGELLGGLEALGARDPRLLGRHPGLGRLRVPWRLDHRELRRLARWLAARSELPAPVGGQAGLVRLDCSSLEDLGPWRLTIQTRSGPRSGPLLCRALLDQLSAWGTRAGIEEAPGLWLVWANWD